MRAALPLEVRSGEPKNEVLAQALGYQLSSTHAAPKHKPASTEQRGAFKISRLKRRLGCQLSNEMIPYTGPSFNCSYTCVLAPDLTAFLKGVRV